MSTRAKKKSAATRLNKIARRNSEFKKLEPLPNEEAELIQAITVLKMHDVDTVVSHLRRRHRTMMLNRIAKKHGITLKQMRAIARENNSGD